MFEEDWAKSFGDGLGENKKEKKQKRKE